jgi:hypothetical protein
MKDGICISRRADRNFESLGPVRSHASSSHPTNPNRFIADTVRCFKRRQAAIVPRAFCRRQVIPNPRSLFPLLMPP